MIMTERRALLITVLANTTRALSLATILDTCGTSYLTIAKILVGAQQQVIYFLQMKIEFVKT